VDVATPGEDRRMHLVLALLLALSPPPAWAWPVDGGHAILRPYLAPQSDYGAGHRGIDIASTAVLRAPADGVVRYSGTVVDRGVLSIDHGGGVISSFEPVTSSLHTGDVVHRGEVIGEIRPGHCAELCVHLGVRLNGAYVSPLNYLGGVSRAVLLPTRTLSAG
jgi:murein DD-endopeptidase MepM/ murein hydrolase activator NlpD